MKTAAGRASIALDDARPIWQSLAIFLGPLMLSNVLQSLGQTANSVYLGRMIGVSALAAVSAIFPLVFLLISFVIGLGAGSSVLIAQAYGAGERTKVKEIAGAAIALTTVIGVLVGTLGAIFAHPLLRALGTPLDVLDVSTSYAHILFSSFPLLFLFLMYTTFLRGTGDTRTPFFVLVASTALTFALTPLYIRGWLGIPALGTNGAAVGNISSTLISVVGLIVYLNAKKHPLAFDREMVAHLRLRPELLAKITKIGIPTSLNLVMLSLSEIAVLAFVNHFGSVALAAYGAVNQIVSYVQFPAVSIGIAASVFGAQSIGAGRTDRLPTIVRSAVVLNYVIEGTLIAIVYLFSTPVLSLFITSPSTVLVAHRLLVIILWSFAIFGNARVLSAIMISSGTVVWPTLLSILSIWAVEVPIAYVLMGRFGLDGVWYGYPAGYLAGLIFQATYYRFVWKRKPLQRLV